MSGIGAMAGVGEAAALRVRRQGGGDRSPIPHGRRLGLDQFLGAASTTQDNMSPIKDDHTEHADDDGRRHPEFFTAHAMGLLVGASATTNCTFIECDAPSSSVTVRLTE